MTVVNKYVQIIIRDADFNVLLVKRTSQPEENMTLMLPRTEILDTTGDCYTTAIKHICKELLGKEVDASSFRGMWYLCIHKEPNEHLMTVVYDVDEMHLTTNLNEYREYGWTSVEACMTSPNIVDLHSKDALLVLIEEKIKNWRRETDEQFRKTFDGVSYGRLN